MSLDDDDDEEEGEEGERGGGGGGPSLVGSLRKNAMAVGASKAVLVVRVFLNLNLFHRVNGFLAGSAFLQLHSHPHTLAAAHLTRRDRSGH